MPVTKDLVLVKLDQCQVLLRDCRTIEDAIKLEALADALSIYATKVNAGIETTNRCTAFQIKAERNLGIILARTPKAKGTRGQGRPNLGGNKSEPPKDTTPTLEQLGISKKTSATSRKLAHKKEREIDEYIDKATKEGKQVTSNEVISALIKSKNKQIRKNRIIAETKHALIEKAIIAEADCLDIIKTIPPIDLLLADPPYFTEGDFTGHISDCLSKVKKSGQAYIFMSSDADEIAAYLQMNPHSLKLTQILVWNYNNTGQRQPNKRYTANYQIIFYYRGDDAPDINKPGDGTHQYACQTINAPDARLGDRYHKWQKPIELLERLIRNSSQPGDFIFDPFAGSGSTLLAAAKLGRRSLGCDTDPDAVKICVERGCVPC